MTPYLHADLAHDEGLRLTAYKDEFGNLTIGYGHCGPDVHEGLVWTEAQASAALDNDIEHAAGELDLEFPWWRTNLNDARQDVFCMMCFNLGIHGFMEFHETIGEVKADDYPDAAADMLKSLWAEQVGERAIRLSNQMRTGVRIPPT